MTGKQALLIYYRMVMGLGYPLPTIVLTWAQCEIGFCQGIFLLLWFVCVISLLCPHFILCLLPFFVHAQVVYGFYYLASSPNVFIVPIKILLEKSYVFVSLHL